MRLLLLGGTAWLGSTIAAAAVERGHQVVCVARGESGDPPDGARLVRSDRNGPGALDEVAGVSGASEHEWDVVVDVSRQPGQVRAAVEGLSGSVKRAVFVSSASVYADHATPGQDESAEVLPPLDGDVMESMETYGEAKVACEQAVRSGFGDDRALIIRAGLIGGPGDASGRSGYWPLRFRYPSVDDDAVLVPDVPDLPTQVIDVRDLAGWVVRAAEGGVAGVFNAAGGTVPLGEHLEAARRVAGHAGPLVPVPPEWLVEQGVEPWMGPRSLPLWLPMPTYAGFCTRDGSAARAAGLVSRPLRDTLADVLAWEVEQGVDRPRGAGLSRRDERELLSLARPW